MPHTGVKKGQFFRLIIAPKKTVIITVFLHERILRLKNFRNSYSPESESPTVIEPDNYSLLIEIHISLDQKAEYMASKSDIFCAYD